HRPRHLVGRPQGRTNHRGKKGRGDEGRGEVSLRAPADIYPLSAPGGGEGWGEVGDSRAPAGAHLTLPSLRDGPLPLPPEGRRGVFRAAHRISPDPVALDRGAVELDAETGAFGQLDRAVAFQLERL